MLALEGSRTNDSLKIAFSDEARFDRLYLRYEQAAEACGSRDLAAFLRSAARDGAACANGHLDYLTESDLSASLDPVGRSAGELTKVIAAMTEDHIAMYAAMARTARDEGFEDIADWFETLAKSGRSRALRLRRVTENTR
jgi:rubrerythrin